MDIYRKIVELREQGQDCALCTIVETKGSTPGKSMMKMLVQRDGSFVGSVGGGCLEAEVLEAALASLSDERPRLLSFALNERDYPDSGLICGGRLSIYVEPIVEPRLYLFGGGHVSAAVAKLAHSVGFHVTVADDRAEFANSERHPHAQAFHGGPFAALIQKVAPLSDAYVIAATRGHDQDGLVLSALAKHHCRPRYLGMIGSQAKKAVLFEQLQAAGVSAEFLAQVESPMGLPIGARTHDEIAISVVARLIEIRRLGGPGAPLR
jgi:xanthine dehydrogenase accessory factor